MLSSVARIEREFSRMEKLFPEHSGSQTEIEFELPERYEVQQQVSDEAARWNVVDCGRRWGKTELGLIEAGEVMLPGFPVGWFAPNYKILADAWRRAKIMFHPVMLSKNETERRIELVGGGLLEMWTLESGMEVGRGRKYKRVIVDEAARVPDLESAWTYAIRPTLTDYAGDAWFLSTPKGRNFFWRLFVLGQDPEYGEYRSWKMPSASNPYLPASEIETAREEMPYRVFQQEYLAEFLEDEGAVFRNISASVGEYEPVFKEHDGHRKVAGVDWGKHNDFTAISVGCADCRMELFRDRFNQIDYSFQRGRIKAAEEKWRVRAFLPERNSMGEPIVEQLSRDGIRILPGPDGQQGFMTTAQSKPRLIENLALIFEREEWKFLDDPVWTAELEAYERTVSPVTGRPRYSAPEGLHDDTVIARALMVWAAGNYAHLPDKQPGQQSKFLQGRVTDGQSRWKRDWSG